METFDDGLLSDVEGEEFMDHTFHSPTTEFDFEHEDHFEIGEPKPIPQNYIPLDPELFGRLGVPQPKEGWEKASIREAVPAQKTFDLPFPFQ